MNTSFLEILNKNIPVNTRIINWSVDNKFKVPYYTYLGIVNQRCILLHPETNKEINVSLYEHFEFELSKKELIPKSPVMHYAMVRNPDIENIK